MLLLLLCSVALSLFYQLNTYLVPMRSPSNSFLACPSSSDTMSHSVVFVFIVHRYYSSNAHVSFILNAATRYIYCFVPILRSTWIMITFIILNMFGIRCVCDLFMCSTHSHIRHKKVLCAWHHFYPKKNKKPKTKNKWTNNVNWFSEFWLLDGLVFYFNKIVYCQQNNKCTSNFVY